MILVVDIGNTQISIGVYENGKCKNMTSFICQNDVSTETIEQLLPQLIQHKNIENCIISSVVDELTEKVHRAILHTFYVNSLVLSTDLNTGINIKCHNPEKIGTDRIANACAAAKLYNKRPLIVVDSGSATTFDIIDENNDFIGGLIMPGLNMQLKSLTENTSKLPEINLDLMDKVQTYINTDTKKAILSGVVFGQAQAIQGLITRCEKELKSKAFIVGSGGNAKLLSKYMRYRKFNVINAMLTLDGIYMIYELNME